MRNSSRDLQSLTSYEIGKVKEKRVLTILLYAYLFLPVLHVFVLIFLHYKLKKPQWFRHQYWAEELNVLSSSTRKITF